MADIEYIVKMTHEPPNLQKRLERFNRENLNRALTPEEIEAFDPEDKTFYFPNGTQMTADEQDLYIDFMLYPENYPGLVPQTVTYSPEYEIRRRIREEFALPDTGRISMSMIQAEVDGTGQCNMNSAEFRALIDRAAGAMQKLSEYYGKSAAPDGPDLTWADYDVEIKLGQRGESDVSNSYFTTYYEYTYGGVATVYDNGGFDFKGYRHGGSNSQSKTSSFTSSSEIGVQQGWHQINAFQSLAMPSARDTMSPPRYHYRNGTRTSGQNNTWSESNADPLRFWVLSKGSYGAVQNPTLYRATHK